ncbi:MAG: CDP-diacylglycerol--serine O-phosphatidyltransferase [Verrucomicrobium sp.]|nr:CDP-diacylglycerol--serine O-phosphatidyltransferase [Verrucomicrobium sp.]
MKPNHPPHKIYLLPNLMTAGNLICGFLAVLRIFQGTIDRSGGGENWIQIYESSLTFILYACIFDMLDGQVARRGGTESPFGREFDSLADIVSFGVAPALLVFEIVLKEIPFRLGWILAAFYLMCGALRLARFNVHASLPSVPGASKEFTGFPIPAAAGLVSSITLLMLYYYETDRELERGWGKYLLAALLFFLSIMMFSRFKYPSFKGFSLRTEHSLGKFIATVALLFLTIVYYHWMLAVVFVSYLLYGFFRPFVSRALRRQIEEEDDDDEDDAPLFKDLPPSR